jgi:hypothetical protein
MPFSSGTGIQGLVGGGLQLALAVLVIIPWLLPEIKELLDT